MTFSIDTLIILIFIPVRCTIVMWQWQNETFWVGIFLGFALSTFLSGWFLFHQFFGRFTKIHLIFTHSTHSLEKGKCEFYSETNTILIMWTLTESLSPPSVESSSPARVGSQLTEGSQMLTIKHILEYFRDVFFVFVDNHLTDFLSDFLCICLP